MLGFFMLGTIIGSFLNVVIYRHNTGISLLGRSFCFTCGRTLRWFELIPVVSYVLQRGQCRQCRSVISFQYPLVEILAGLLFVVVFLKGLPLLVTYLFSLAFAMLLVISVYDIRHTIIPDVWVGIFIMLALINLGIGVWINSSMTSDMLAWNLGAGPLLALPFALLWLVSGGEWMGLGDAKLALGIGWFLGMSSGIASVFLAFWIGAIWGIILLLWGGKRFTIKHEIPFGPFLAISTLIVFFFDIDFVTLQSFFINLLS